MKIQRLLQTFEAFEEKVLFKFLDNVGNNGKGFGELTFIHSPLVSVLVEKEVSMNGHMMTLSSMA